jgi:hypothetical protein
MAERTRKGPPAFSRRKKYKVESIKHYTKTKYGAVEKAKILANPAVWMPSTSHNVVRQRRPKLRARGQEHKPTAQLLYERDAAKLGRISKGKRRKENLNKVKGLIEDVHRMAPMPKWLKNIRHAIEHTKQSDKMQLTPPNTHSTFASYGSSADHSERELITPRLWQPRTPIEHLKPSVLNKIQHSIGGIGGGNVEKSLVELHRSAFGKPDDQTKLASLEWFTYRYPILLQRDKYVEDKAVVTIGRAWRSYLARQAYSTMLTLARHKANYATKIQKCWRSFIYQKKHQNSIAVLMKTVSKEAITQALSNTLKRIKKEMQERARVQRIEKEKKMKDAEKMRKAKREIWLAKQKQLREREALKKRRQEAASKFQTVWQKHLFRCDIDALVQLRKRRWNAAINIQKRVRARAVQARFHEIYTRLKGLQEARITREAAETIQRCFLRYRGRKWAPRMLFGLYVRDLTQADYELPAPRNLQKWVFEDDPDYTDYRRFCYWESDAYKRASLSTDQSREKQLLKSQIEYASTCHLVGHLKSAVAGWKTLVDRKIGDGKVTLNSVAYVSQMILACHSAGMYEQAEPWMGKCVEVIRQLELRKKMANRMRIRIVCTPFWKQFLLIFYRAKKRQAAAARHFKILLGRKMHDAYSRWSFFTIACIFNRMATVRSTFLKWRRSARAIIRVRNILLSVESNVKLKHLRAWQEAAFEERRTRWVMRAAVQFADKMTMRHWLSVWKSFSHFRRTVHYAVDNIQNVLHRLQKEAMRIWKWFPSPVMEQWAALQIQSMYRGWKGKRLFRSVERKRALARLNAQEAAEERSRLDAAAAKIQGLYRMKKGWERRMERVLWLLEEKKLREERIKELLFEFQEVKEELSWLGSTPNTREKKSKKAKASSVYAEKARKGLRTTVRLYKDNLKKVIKKTAPKLVKQQVRSIAKEIRAEGKVLKRPKKKVENQVKQAVNMHKRKTKAQREAAYAKYKKYLVYQEVNKKDIEIYSHEEEVAEADLEEFKTLDEVKQIETKIKEARQQIQDDASSRISALFRGLVTYKRLDIQRKIRTDTEKLDKWAAQVIQTWWRRVQAVSLLHQRQNEKEHEAKRKWGLKIVRKVRSLVSNEKANVEVHERNWLARLDKSGLTEERLLRAEEKIFNVIKKIRCTTKRAEQVEKALTKFPKLFRVWDQHYPKLLKPPGWGEPDMSDPTVIIERFFNDMHDVILDFPAVYVPFKEEGPFVYIKLKLAVKEVNKKMKVFENSVHFDVHSVSKGFLARGGKLCRKKIEFPGFDIPGGAGPLPPQKFGIWKVSVFHPKLGWLRQTAAREATVNFSNSTFGANVHMSMQEIMRKLEDEQARRKAEDQAKLRIKKEQEAAAEEGKLKALHMSKFKYIDILDETFDVGIAYEILGGERIIEKEKKELTNDEEAFKKRKAAEALAAELAKVPPMEGEIDKGSEEDLSKLARTYGIHHYDAAEHYSEHIMCVVCMKKDSRERPAARLCHKCDKAFCASCWYRTHPRRGIQHNWTKIDPYHDSKKHPDAETHLEILEQHNYMMHLQQIQPNRFAKLQYAMKWKWTDEEMGKARQIFVDMDKARSGRVGINAAAQICRTVLNKRTDEMPVIKMSLLKAWKVNQIPEDGISFSELMRLFVPFYEYLKINMRERLKIRVATHGNDDGDKINLGMWTAAKNKRKEGEL